MKKTNFSWSGTRTIIVYDLNNGETITAQDIASKSNKLSDRILFKNNDLFQLPNTTLRSPLFRDDAKGAFLEAFEKTLLEKSSNASISRLLIIEVFGQDAYILGEDNA